MNTLWNWSNTYIMWNLCWKSYALFSLGKEEYICLLSSNPTPNHWAISLTVNVNLKYKILWQIFTLSFYQTSISTSSSYSSMHCLVIEKFPFWVKFWGRLCRVGYLWDLSLDLQLSIPLDLSICPVYSVKPPRLWTHARVLLSGFGLRSW